MQMLEALELVEDDEVGLERTDAGMGQQVAQLADQVRAVLSVELGMYLRLRGKRSHRSSKRSRRLRRPSPRPPGPLALGPSQSLCPPFIQRILLALLAELVVESSSCVARREKRSWAPRGGSPELLEESVKDAAFGRSTQARLVELERGTRRERHQVQLGVEPRHADRQECEP